MSCLSMAVPRPGMLPMRCGLYSGGPQGTCPLEVSENRVCIRAEARRQHEDTVSDVPGDEPLVRLGFMASPNLRKPLANTDARSEMTQLEPFRFYCATDERVNVRDWHTTQYGGIVCHLARWVIRSVVKLRLVLWWLLVGRQCRTSPPPPEPRK